MFRIKLQFWDWDFWDWAIQNPSFVVSVKYSLLVSIALIIVSGSCNILVWFRVGLLSLPLSYKQSICTCSKLIILVGLFSSEPPFWGHHELLQRSVLLQGFLTVFLCLRQTRQHSHILVLLSADCSFS